MNNAIKLYYASTLLFVVLDYLMNINVRVAFLENWPSARLVYYAICFACLAVVIWRPAWSALVGAIESLTVIVALTIGMALRVMIVTDEMIEQGTGAVTSQELLNYLISGTIAYIAWFRGVQALKGTKIV